MIAWETDLSKALARAKAEQKCVMLMFFSSECIGCKQMDAVSFEDGMVGNFIASRLIPVRIEANGRGTATDFRIMWTPTTIILDLYGNEHQRTIGYLPPEELVANLLLGVGKASFVNDQFSEAVIHLNTLLNGYPESGAAPEAVYLRGVARFKSTHSPEALKEVCRQLREKYPNSSWTRRAEPFEQL